MLKTSSLAVTAFGLVLCAAASPALAGDGTNLYAMMSQDTQMVTARHQINSHYGEMSSCSV